jgi:hypothetical protein
MRCCSSFVTQYLNRMFVPNRTLMDTADTVPGFPQA